MTRGERREPEGTRVPPIFIVEPITPEQMDRARRAVCSGAHNATDARMLPSALGLDGGEA